MLHFGMLERNRSNKWQIKDRKMNRSYAIAALIALTGTPTLSDDAFLQEETVKYVESGKIHCGLQWHTPDEVGTYHWVVARPTNSRTPVTVTVGWTPKVDRPGPIVRMEVVTIKLGDFLDILTSGFMDDTGVIAAGWKTVADGNELLSMIDETHTVSVYGIFAQSFEEPWRFSIDPTEIGKTFVSECINQEL